MTPPRIVLDAGADLAPAVRELTRDGWRLHRGFTLPEEPWDLAPSRLVLTGDVAGEAEAQAVLVAAVRGAGLAVRLDLRQPWAAGFLADLARLDAQLAPPVRPGASRPPAPDVAAAVGRLTPEQRQLLDLLAGGASIAQAARQLFLSLRTANRRVATARDALGVSSTREAVLAYVRLRDG
jgi:DNA-binding NarL/FixJ family response regulator